MRHLCGSAAELHGRDIDWSRRSATVCEVTEPALVLGSTQQLVAGTAPGGAGAPASARRPGLRGARPGASIVRRRTGGGAVWVVPGDPLWVDVVVPRDDPRWEEDVGRAFWWVGEAWVAALDEVGVVGGEVHRGGLFATPWSRHVCFAGLGPGEVTVAGRKVVGIAQRRTRHGALFQCAVHRTWDPAPLVAALGLLPQAADDLADVALGVPDPEYIAPVFAALCTPD